MIAPQHTCNISAILPRPCYTLLRPNQWRSLTLCRLRGGKAAGVALAMPHMRSDALTRTLDPQQLWQGVQIPPQGHLLGARVEHLLVEQGGPLSAAIAALLQLPVALVLRLMAFGAVYYCPVPPESRATAPLADASPQARSRLAEARKQALQRWGRGTQFQHPKRVLEECEASPYGYVRVHLQPKRCLLYDVQRRCTWSSHDSMHDARLRRRCISYESRAGSEATFVVPAACHSGVCVHH